MAPGKPRRGVLATLLLLAAALAAALIGGSAHSTAAARADSAGTLVAPDDSTALSLAAQTGQPVVSVADISSTQLVLANPDGTLTASIASAPVRVPDDSSQTGWAPVDTTLADTGPSVTPALTDAQISFSDGGTGDLATLGNGSGDQYAETWNGSLPVPQLNGNTATYPDIQPGIDLTLQARADGFEQDWIIHSAADAPATLTIPLALAGLHASVAADGSLILTNAQGHQVATADDALMWGATKDPTTQEPTQQETVSTKIISTPQGPAIQLTPDPSFFQNPNVSYPVTIDPTPSLATTQDTYVRSDFATTSYSTDVQLKLGTANGVNKIRAMAYFDTSSLAGKDIKSAQLNTWEEWSTACNATSTTQVWDLSGPFDSTTTWNTAPGVNQMWASASSSWGYDSTCPNAALDFTGGGTGGTSLTNLVQAWAAGTSTNYGIELKAANESDLNSFKKFASADEGINPAHTPTLNVTYNSYPDTPALASPEAGQTAVSQDASGDVTPTATPEFDATFSDADGGSGSVLYTVYKRKSDGTNGALVVSGSGSTVASGQTSSYTVSSGVLTDGSKYNVVASGYDGTDYSVTPSSSWFKVNLELAITTETGDGSDPADSTVTTPADSDAQAAAYAASGMTAYQTAINAGFTTDQATQFSVAAQEDAPGNAPVRTQDCLASSKHSTPFSGEVCWVRYTVLDESPYYVTRDLIWGSGHGGSDWLFEIGVGISYGYGNIVDYSPKSSFTSSCQSPWTLSAFGVSYQLSEVCSKIVPVLPVDSVPWTSPAGWGRTHYGDIWGGISMNSGDVRSVAALVEDKVAYGSSSEILWHYKYKHG